MTKISKERWKEISKATIIEHGRLRIHPDIILEDGERKDMILEEGELKEIISGLKEMIGLLSLNLNELGIKKLPPEIAELTSLEALHIRDNKLTTVPKELAQLTNLQMLELSGNQLTTLPKELAQLTQLTTLGLAGNNLTELPDVIPRLPKLDELQLYITMNYFSEAELQKIEDVMKEHPKAAIRKGLESRKPAIQPPTLTGDELQRLTRAESNTAAAETPESTPGNNQETDQRNTAKRPRLR